MSDHISYRVFKSRPSYVYSCLKVNRLLQQHDLFAKNKFEVGADLLCLTLLNFIKDKKIIVRRLISKLIRLFRTPSKLKNKL